MKTVILIFAALTLTLPMASQAMSCKRTLTFTEMASYGMSPTERKSMTVSDFYQLLAELQRADPSLADLALRFEFKEGGEARDAVAYPIGGRAVFDMSLFKYGDRVLPDFVVGHEAGHVILQHVMMKLLAQPGRNIRQVPVDVQLIRNTNQNLESNYPILKTCTEQTDFLTGVPLQTLAVYKTNLIYLRSLGSRDAKIAQDAKELTQQEYAQLVVAQMLGSFHEFYSDFLGAVTAREAEAAKYVFTDKVQQWIRNFKNDPEKMPTSDPEFRAAMSVMAENGIPHIALMFMRWSVYAHFYQSTGREIGSNWQYDALVAKEIPQSLLATLMEVMHTNPDTPVKEGAGAMALKMVGVFDSQIQRAKTRSLGAIRQVPLYVPPVETVRSQTIPARQQTAPAPRVEEEQVLIDSNGNEIRRQRQGGR